MTKLLMRRPSPQLLFREGQCSRSLNRDFVTIAFDWPGVGACSAPIGPRPCPGTGSHLRALHTAQASGSCSPCSVLSSRGTFCPLLPGTSGSHPRGHKPRRCSCPALPPSAFTSQLPRSWKVGAVGKPKSNSVSVAQARVSTRV